MQSPERLALRFPSVEPPGGWRWIDDGKTGVEIKAGHRAALHLAVSKFLSENGRDVPVDLPEIVDDWLCRHAPPEFTLGAAENHPGRHFSSASIKTITGRVLREARGKTVETALQGRRSETCKVCPGNVPTSGCSGCGGLKMWVREWLGELPPGSEWLQVCQFAIAMLTALVQARSETLQRCLGRYDLAGFPEACWLRKELQHERE